MAAVLWRVISLTAPACIQHLPEVMRPHMLEQILNLEFSAVLEWLFVK
jgi:hypothetical protein